jgi:hypothetical protein
VDRCRARFERHEPCDKKTHTCDQTMGHTVQGVPHHCPRCDAWWRPGVGVVPDPRIRQENPDE